MNQRKFEKQPTEETTKEGSEQIDKQNIDAKMIHAKEDSQK